VFFRTPAIVSVSLPAPSTRIPAPPSLKVGDVSNVTLPPVTVTKSSVRSPVPATSKMRNSGAPPARWIVAPLPWMSVLPVTTGRPVTPLFTAVSE